jgi:hypothetical protein
VFAWWRKSKKRKPKPHAAELQGGYQFRRSRTITGSTSDTVAITRSNKPQLKTSRMRFNELHQERGRVLRWLACLVVLVLGLIWLIANYTANIEVSFKDQVTGDSPSLDAYQKSVSNYYSQHPFERFGVLLNHAEIKNYLMNYHSEVKSFTASKQWFGGGVRFEVEFRRPLLVWRNADKQLYVDGEGIAFEYNHYGAQELVTIEDKSGIASAAGESVASKRFIKFVGQLAQAVNDNGQGRVVGIIIPPSTRQIDLMLEGRGYVIKTHIDRSPAEQASDIKNTLSYLDAQGIVPQYVDVRVAGKAYYK